MDKHHFYQFYVIVELYVITDSQLYTQNKEINDNNDSYFPAVAVDTHN